MRKKFNYILTATLTIYIILFITLSFLSSIKKIPFITLNKNSILKEFNNIDYIAFLKLFSVCVLISCVIIFIVAKTCWTMLNKNQRDVENIAIFLIKITSSISIIIPMTVTFSKEQFNVAATYLSFIALFSFVLPKRNKSNFDNKELDEVRNSSPKEQK